MKKIKKTLQYCIELCKFLIHDYRRGYTLQQFKDYYYLKSCGVETQLGYVNLFGTKPIIFKCPHSRIIMEKGVSLVSNNYVNPAGISKPVVIATLAEGAEIFLGKDCGMSGATLCAAKKITIGEYVGLGANVSIYDTDFHPLDPYLRRYGKLEDTRVAPVMIGDYAWIGANSMILKGVNVFRGAVIGAGSVVTHDVPELTVVAGNPAKVVKKIDMRDETYDYLFNASKK